MPNPPRFTPPFDFSDFEEVQPNTPKPGVQLDACFDDLSEVTTGLRDAIIDIRRSDGALQNGIVTEDSLAPGLLDALSSETGAAEAAASAAAASASAASAAESASELDAAVDVISQLGALLDWGDITAPAGETLDYGDIT